MQYVGVDHCLGEQTIQAIHYQLSKVICTPAENVPGYAQLHTEIPPLRCSIKSGWSSEQNELTTTGTELVFRLNSASTKQMKPPASSASFHWYIATT